MTQQLAAERRALLARKRAQQEERRRKADDLERILHENQRKVAPQECLYIKCCTVVLVPTAACADCTPRTVSSMPFSAVLLLQAARHGMFEAV